MVRGPASPRAELNDVCWKPNPAYFSALTMVLTLCLIMPS